MSHAGEIAAVATAVCWTLTALAFESAGRRIGAVSLNLIRLMLGLIFLTVVCWTRSGMVLPFDATAHAWIWLGISGVVGLTLGDLCLFRAFILIGARLSMLVMALVPPMTALLGWMLMGEVLDTRELVGMALTVGGVAWVVSERKPGRNGGTEQKKHIGGILLAVCGAAGQASGLVLSKIGMGDFDAFASTQIRVLAGLAGFIVLYSLIGWWPKVASAVQDRGAMGRVSIGAFFGPFLGVSLSLIAVQLTQAGVAATLMSLVPVLIIVPAVLLFKEKVSPRAIVGSVIAVLGGALLFL
ncbi:MAG: DMT family transporter [bacterium]|nr:DMT family transporter [bacterium]